MMRRTRHVISLGAAILAAGTVASGPSWASPPPSYTSRYDYLCTQPSPAGTAVWDVENCCTGSSAPSFTCNGSGETAKPNILLVVSDDHDYCHYGFMAGLCSKSRYTSCTREQDCEGGLGRCVGSRDLKVCSGNQDLTCVADPECAAASAGTCSVSLPSTMDVPLRLNDLACRNRQPKLGEDSTWCGSGDKANLDKSPSLTFDRGEAPCSGTPPDAFPSMKTPHLDALAKKAAVFPRAYVAGTYCKNSRRTILHGRYMKHLQWLFRDGAPGAYECPRTGTGTAPEGCSALSVTGECAAGSSLQCQDAHTVAWWPQLGSGVPSGANQYRSFAFAKTEVLTEGQGGFDGDVSKMTKGLAKVRCSKESNSTNCQNVLSNAPNSTSFFPTAAMFDQPTPSLYEITEAIDSTIEAGHVQKHPFFIWFGPHIPHKGKNAEKFFQQMYDPSMHKVERLHYARVTWLDSVLGGLFYHLKRSCTCKGTAKQSLWSNTVVIFLADQGFLLPGAKHNTKEQTQRTPLIVSTPDHRKAASPTPARVFDRELANAIDIMPTVLAYAGGTYFSGTSLRDDYPHGRDLTGLIETGSYPSSVKRRALSFGEQGTDNVNGMGFANDNVEGWPRYVVTRPGLLGVCEKPYNFTASDPDADCGASDRCHVHPCLSDSDCIWNSGSVNLGYCVCPPASESPTCSGSSTSDAWQRCVNRPDVRCDPVDGEAECASAVTNGSGTRYQDLCDTTPTPDVCRDAPSAGSFKDFVERECTINSNACVPPGVCKPLILKAQANNSSGLVAAWDLDYAPDWDPDGPEQVGVNLLEGTYLQGASPDFESRFMECLSVYMNLSPSSDAWADNSTICPAALADWR